MKVGSATFNLASFAFIHARKTPKRGAAVISARSRHGKRRKSTRGRFSSSNATNAVRCLHDGIFEPHLGRDGGNSCHIQDQPCDRYPHAARIEAHTAVQSRASSGGATG